MNKEAQIILDRIVALEINALTPDDILFLRARASYLTGDQIHKFESVLQGEAPVVEEEDTIKKILEDDKKKVEKKNKEDKKQLKAETKKEDEK